jgi:hypothetical protein
MTISDEPYRPWDAEGNMRWDSKPYNQTTLEVLWGINTISRHDPFAKIHAGRDIIYFGAYSSRELMTDNERIDLDSWGWFNRCGEWARRV